MVNLEVVLLQLQEIQKRTAHTDSSLKLKQVTERAIQSVSACRSSASSTTAGGIFNPGSHGGPSSEFPARAVVHALLTSLLTKKPRLCEYGLDCLNHLVMHKVIPSNLVLDNAVGGVLGGKSVGWAVVETLCEILIVPDVQVQQKGLECLVRFVTERRFDITGAILLKAIQTSFNVCLTTTNKTVCAASSGGTRELILDNLVLRLVSSSNPCPRNRFFSCRCWVDPTNENEPVNYRELFIRNADVLQLSDAAPIFSHLDQTARDVVTLLRSLLLLGSRRIPPSCNTADSIEVRTRKYALELLVLFFRAVPVGMDMGRILPLLQIELWTCVGRNLAAVAPTAFFDLTIQLIEQLFLKAHYTLHMELRLLLADVLFPICRNPLSSFQQKMSVLTLLRSLLASPEFIVAAFINYDSNPMFAMEGRKSSEKIPPGSGMLDFMLEFVADVMFTDFVKKDWFTWDQQVLLRCECLHIIEGFASGMWNWLSDEMEGATVQSVTQPSSIRNEGYGSTPGGGSMATRNDSLFSPLNKDGSYNSNNTNIGGGQFGGDNSPLDEARRKFSVEREQAYIDWMSGDFPLNDPEIQATTTTVGHTALNTTATNSSSGILDTDNKYNDDDDSAIDRPPYHWKHIHQLLTNKNILVEASEKFKTSWKHSFKFLVDRHVIENDLKALATFIRRTPMIDREATHRVFSSMLKDTDTLTLFKEYIGTFQYHGLPLDIAFRGTVTEFLVSTMVQPEKQVWDKIEDFFADEYAKQNPGTLSAEATGRMVSMLLMYHNLIHKLKSSELLSNDFILGANILLGCSEETIPEPELMAMYRRLAEKPWGPEHSASAQSAAGASAAAGSQLSSAAAAAPTTITTGGGNGGNSAAKRSGGNESSLAPSSSAAAAASSTSSGGKGQQQQDILSSDLWDGKLKVYTSNITNLLPHQQMQIRYVTFANECFSTFDSELRQMLARATVLRQPYAFPFYAQHVKPMLLAFYPLMTACIYLALRTLPHQHILQGTEEYFHCTLDIAAAFSVNLQALNPSVERAVTKLLDRPNAADTGRLSPALCFYLMHRL